MSEVTEDWIEQYDPESKSIYFYNKRTDETSWTRPESSPDAEEEGKHAAATKIQCTFRGLEGRKEAKVLQNQSEKWIKQYDPATKTSYYYNTETCSSQWEIPKGFVPGRSDSSLNAALTIQCAFRSKIARRNTTALKSNKKEPPEKNSGEDVKTALLQSPSLGEKKLSAKKCEVHYLKMCRDKWNKGRELKESDMAVKESLTSNQEESVELEKMRIHVNAVKERQLWVERPELNVWDGVREGCTIPKLKELLEKEDKLVSNKAGKRFRLNDPHPTTGETLIQVASWWGHSQLVKYFLDSDVDPNQIDCLDNKFTLLHDAARSGASSEVIQILVDAGIKVNTADACGDTPLHWAVRKNNTEIVLALMATDARNSVGMTPVWQSIVAVNSRGRTALDIAVHNKNTHIQKILMQYESKLPIRQEQQTSMVEHINQTTKRHMLALKKFGRKTGREAVQRKRRSRVNTELNDETTKYSKKQFELARRAGMRWKKRAMKNVKLSPLES